MGHLELQIGDAIQGTVLGQIESGMTLDAYFSVLAVKLRQGPVIRVVFFRDDDGGFGPNAGETFQACVGNSIFEKAPFTTMSRFMLNNILIEGRARPSRPKSKPDPSKDPIAWLNGVIENCGL